MLTVTELANRSGATPHAVRYYTRMGLLRPERNPDNGYRLYEYREVGWLCFIRQAKRLGYTLNEIREIMHDSDPVSYKHLTLPTNVSMCRSRWSPYH